MSTSAVTTARGPQDPGFALERTRLAWTRSALSLGTVGALALHAALAGRAPGAAYACAALAFASAAASWRTARRLYVERSHCELAAGAQPATRPLQGLTAVAVLAAIAAAAVTLSG